MVRGIDGAAIITDPYPDNAKDEWVVAPLTPVRRRSGLLVWSSEVYANQSSKDAGGRPFLINSWKSQIRAITPEGEHQRIQTDAQGRLLHASREAVAPEDVEDFLLLPSTLRWFNDTGQFLDPWMFPTYDGVLEGLDPQWLRERFSLPGQIEANIDRYLRGAFDRKLDGDHRGTTLDLQVGATADDGKVSVGVGSNIRTGVTAFDTSFPAIGCVTTGSGVRFAAWGRLANVTVPAKANIDTAHGTWRAFNADTSSCEFTVDQDDSDNAASPTSTTEWNARAYTSARITWDFSTNWDSDTEHDTPETKTVTQEVVDRPGWASGQAMSVNTLDDLDADADQERGPYDYGDDSSKAFKYHIEYTAPGPVTILRRRREGA